MHVAALLSCARHDVRSGASSSVLAQHVAPGLASLAQPSWGVIPLFTVGLVLLCIVSHSVDLFCTSHALLFMRAVRGPAF